MGEFHKMIQRLSANTVNERWLRDRCAEIAAKADARIAALEAEKAEREAQEPVAFRWLGPGKGWRPVYAEPPVPHVDPEGAGADFVGWLGPRGIFMEDEIYQAWKEYRKDPSAAQYRKVYAAPPVLREPTDEEAMP